MTRHDGLITKCNSIVIEILCKSGDSCHTTPHGKGLVAEANSAKQGGLARKYLFINLVISLADRAALVDMYASSFVQYLDQNI